jgi:two-component system phosphate regulon response regulator PhoB
MTVRNILLVEDEQAIRDMVGLALKQAGFGFTEASNAHQAEEKIKAAMPDLILLDWMMPGLSGIDFARKLRSHKNTTELPIIMLTARTDEDDLVRGLAEGVDDYITKPFSTRELVARINAIFRRTNRKESSATISVEGLTLDAVSHRVTVNGHDLALGPTEFKLLQFFMNNVERVFSREQILNHVWGDNVYIEERTVDVHIRRLRKTLEPSGHDKLIQTVRSTGNLFIVVSYGPLA